MNEIEEGLKKKSKKLEKIKNSPKLGFQFKTLENRGHAAAPIIQCIFYIFEKKGGRLGSVWSRWYWCRVQEWVKLKETLDFSVENWGF